MPHRCTTTEDGWDDLTRLAARLDSSTLPPPGLPAEERRAWVTAALRGLRLDVTQDREHQGAVTTER